MTRFLIAIALALSFSSASFAQDMPLSQILIDGEGWKKMEKPGVKPPPRKEGTVFIAAYSPDGGTVFGTIGSAAFITAAPVGADNQPLWLPTRYAALRTPHGEKTVGVGGLATDRDGRIYAATEIGVQVFDPTGRLCGVLTPAAPGAPEAMAFEGDKLTLWHGETKYTRKLKTTGVK